MTINWTLPWAETWRRALKRTKFETNSATNFPNPRYIKGHIEGDSGAHPPILHPKDVARKQEHQSRGETKTHIKKGHRDTQTGREEKLFTSSSLLLNRNLAHSFSGPRLIARSHTKSYGAFRRSSTPGRCWMHDWGMPQWDKSLGRKVGRKDSEEAKTKQFDCYSQTYWTTVENVCTALSNTVPNYCMFMSKLPSELLYITRCHF